MSQQNTPQVTAADARNTGAAAKAAIDAAKAKQATGAGPQAPADGAKKDADKKDAPGKGDLSPKNKITRGVPADWKTTWVPIDLNPQDHDLVVRAAKTRKMSVLDLYKAIVKAEFGKKDVWDAIVADAAKAPEPKASSASLDGKTPEQLAVAVSKAEASLARIRERMELIKSQQAAAKAAADGTAKA